MRRPSKQYRRAIALQEKLAADSPSVPEYRSDLATSHLDLGILLEETAATRRPSKRTAGRSRCWRSWWPTRPPCPNIETTWR